MTDKVVSAGNTEYQYYVNTGSRGENQRRRLYLTRIHRASGQKSKVKINQSDLEHIMKMFEILEEIRVNRQNNDKG